MKTRITILASIASLFFLNACGDDATTSVSKTDVSIIADSFDDLEKCEKGNNGDLAYVRDDRTTYSCNGGQWVSYKVYEDSLISEEEFSSSSDKKQSSSSSKISSSSEKSSSSSVKSSSSSQKSSSSSQRSSSSSVKSSSSVGFDCSKNSFCNKIKDECNANSLGNPQKITNNNDYSQYFYCDTNGWQPLKDFAAYDTYGKKCEVEGDTLWGSHEYYKEGDSLHTKPQWRVYECVKGEPVGPRTHLPFTCGDFTQNKILTKKYSSFICHGDAWYLLTQETGTLVDPRDGHEYRTVGVGDHMWMQEDLAYRRTSSNPTYTWDFAAGEVSDEVIDGAATDGDIQGICPDGWRIVSPTDRGELAAFINARAYALDHLDERCYIGKTGWGVNEPDYLKGEDCMNMNFLPREISISGVESKKSDKNHLTGMWIANARYESADALIIENSRYTGGTSVAFNQIATYRRSSSLTIRCVKVEEGEVVYKSAKDVPLYHYKR